MSFLVHLSPKDALEHLERRAERLQEDIAVVTRLLDEKTPTVTRIHLIESEYARAMRIAELNWIQALVADVRGGRLDWNLKTILKRVRATKPQHNKDS